MTATNPLQLRYDKLGPVVVRALQKRHFEAYYCADAKQAMQQAVDLISNEDIVSWGGSVSIEQIGLLNYVKQHYKVIDRDTAASPQQRIELMCQGLLADTFLMSANAVTEDGQLVNIDGNGNRTAALIYGPKKVIVVAGMNKVVRTLEDAYARAHYTAAPAVVQRFPAAKTPCNITGSCAECLGESSCCAQFVRTRLCRPAGRIKVILVGENLGL